MTSTTTTANTIGCLTCSGTGVDPTFGDPCSNCEGTGRKRTAGVTTKPRYTPNLMSPKQRAFVERLRDEMVELGATPEANVLTVALGDENYTSKAASGIIDWALTTLKSVRAAQRDAERQATQAQAASRDIDEGIYVMGTTEAPEIAKVQRSAQGNLYAKAYTVVEGQKGSFDYVPGLIKKVAAEGRKLTLEEAQAIGIRFRVCADCGRVLEVKKSVERGIGPVCWKKWHAGD